MRYLQVDFTEAVDDYSKALMYDDTLTVAYYNRGLIHYRLGEASCSFSKEFSQLQTYYRY